jgi:hypothetical protein
MTDIRRLIYYPEGDIIEMIENDIHNNTKIVVETDCPSCREPYRRETYLSIPQGILILELCPRCERKMTG